MMINTETVFIIIGKGTIICLILKIFWEIWHWVLTVNTDMGYNKRSWIKIYARVTKLEDSENKRGV